MSESGQSDRRPLRDPVLDALRSELTTFRAGAGYPTAGRLSGLRQLVQILGQGASQRAFEELTRLYEIDGADPRTDIGAFFYLSGFGVGKDSIAGRQNEMQRAFGLSYSTSRRHANAGIDELASIIRDRDEENRPWAFISIFQEGTTWHPILDFNLGFESYFHPDVSINGLPIAVEFKPRHDHVDRTRWFERTVLPQQPLKLDVEFSEEVGALRVVWPMPVWPVWQVGAWIADPRIFTRLRTFRQRAVEVSLVWWEKDYPPSKAGLVTGGALWTERPGRHIPNLPPGWESAGQTDEEPDGQRSG